MNQAEDDNWVEEEALPSEPAPAEPFLVRGCLADAATLGLAFLSMGGGILTSCLALAELQPTRQATTLNLAALPLALAWLLRGVACQALVALGLFSFQLHRQVRALVPGMVLVGIMVVLLLVIELNA